MNSHILNLAHWYKTPIGVLFAALLVGGFALGVADVWLGAALCGVAALGIVVPYKLARDRASIVALESKANVSKARAIDEPKLRRSLIQEVERVDALTNSRIDEIEHQIGARIAEIALNLDRTAAQVQGHVDELRREIRDTLHLQMESMTRVERALGASDNLENEVARASEEIRSVRVEMEGQVGQLRREVEHGARRERNERIVGIARAAQAEEQHALVIVLGPPRTGSTWLFDALRAHPDMTFEPTPRALSVLQLANMNRYPSGLSDRENAELDVEVSPGRGARIPEYRVDVPSSESAPKYSVEKIHPLFYDFDTTFFLERLEIASDAGSPVQLIIRLRDPEYTMRSILRYKRRDHGWYKFVSERDVPRHVERSLRSVLEVSASYPVTVSHYEAHAEDEISEMVRVYEAIWPEQSVERHRAVASGLAGVLARRKRNEGLFLGDGPSEVDPGESEIDELVEDASSTLERCKQVIADIQTSASLARTQ